MMTFEGMGFPVKEIKRREKRVHYAVFTESGRKLRMWEYGHHGMWRYPSGKDDKTGQWEYIQLEWDWPTDDKEFGWLYGGDADWRKMEDVAVVLPIEVDGP